MLKWLGSIILLGFIGLCVIAYLYSISLWQAGIIEGRMALKMAAKDYAEHGWVTNYGSRNYQVWLSSNIASIGGTQYLCFIETTNGKFYGEGSLAMTTNQLFIWLDGKRPPQIIGTNYRAPLFPPRF